MHKLNLRTNLIIVFMITSLSVIFQEMLMQSLLLLLSIILVIIKNPSRESLLRIFHRLKKIGKVIFTLLVFQILFRNEGTVYFDYGIISVTSGGMVYGVISSMRFFLIILIAGMLFDVPYSDYLLAFQAWKIPFEISFLVATVIHFIPLFAMEFRKCIEALQLRGIDLNKLSFKARPKAYLSLIFPVIAKAITDVQYRTISLELRGFRLHKKRTSIYSDRLYINDWIIQIMTILIFIGILYLKLS